MMNSLKNVFIFLSFLFGLALLSSFLFPFEDVNGDYLIRGRFDNELEIITDFNELNDYIDKQLYIRNINQNDTALVVLIMDSTLQERFYHGTSRYNLKDNWLAHIAGAILWDDLRMIVIPDHLMQKKTGTCNQMTILFHGLLKNRNFTHRAVGLNQHMVTEVKYSGKWHMYDPDYESLLNHEMSVNGLLKKPGVFQEIYSKTEGAHFNKNFTSLLNTKTAHYYPQNIGLANKLRVFHYISSFFSDFGWLFFALLGIIIHLYKPCVE